MGSGFGKAWQATVQNAKRLGFFALGCGALLMVLAYHPDEASKQLEIGLQNRQEALLQEGGALNGVLKQLPHSENINAPSTPNAPGTSAYQANASESERLQVQQVTQWLQELLSAFPWFQSLGQTPPATADAGPVQANNRVALVPMSLKPKALFVRVKINDAEEGHFILDTGATYTTVSRQMAENLGIDLAHAPRVAITTANGEVKVPRITLRTVQVNNAMAHEVEATVMDFEESSTFSGLLGLSFIQHFKVTLDPVNGQMVFEPNS